MDTIVLMGQFLDYSGYAWAGRSYAKMLNSRFENVIFVDSSVEERVDVTNLSDLELHKKKLKISEIELCFDYKSLRSLTGNVFYFECFLPSMYTYCMNNDVPHAAKILEENKSINLKKISMVAWETNRFPESFTFPLREFGYDALLLHTEEYKNEIETQVGIKTYTNHYPVLELFRPTDPDRAKQQTEVFRILSFNALNKRKGWETLINSYYAAFYDNQDVCLRIKTHGDVQEIAKQILVIKNKNVYTSVRKSEDGKYVYDFQLPECKIEIDTSFLSEEQISEYFKEFDLFATATKGEGFGLTIAQAGLSALPVICPDKGGHNDFCDSNCFKVKSYATCCTDLISEFYNNKEMNLHECDHQSLKDNFSQAYSEWQEGRLHERGLKIYSKMYEYLSTEKSYNKILKIMEDLK